jgi:hypothetical protein
MRRRLARKDGDLNIFTNTTTTSDGNGGHSGGGCGVAEGAAAEGVVVEDEADQICVCFNSIDFFF